MKPHKAAGEALPLRISDPPHEGQGFLQASVELDKSRGKDGAKMLARGSRGRGSEKPFQKLGEGRHLVQGTLPARNHFNPILNLWKPQIYYSMVPVGKAIDGNRNHPQTASCLPISAGQTSQRQSHPGGAALASAGGGEERNQGPSVRLPKCKSGGIMKGIISY